MEVHLVLQMNGYIRTELLNWCPTRQPITFPRRRRRVGVCPPEVVGRSCSKAEDLMVATHDWEH